MALLRSFVRREGHANVPLEHQEEGHPLGFWCSNWRFRLATHPETIPEAQRQALGLLDVAEKDLVGQTGNGTGADTCDAVVSDTQLGVAVSGDSVPACGASVIPGHEDVPEWMRRPEKEVDVALVLPVGFLQPAAPQTTAPTIAFKKRRGMEAH